MERTMERSDKRLLCGILYGLALVMAAMPVSCNYIMSGGIIEEWIRRMQELAAGGMRLFPGAEVFAETGIRVNALDSNLWFFLPAALYRLSGNIVLSYRIFMMAVQTVTLLGAILLFHRVFPGEDAAGGNGCARCLGVILYLTCPYRIFVCYDRADLSEALVWMLVPLYAWAVLGLIRGKGRWREWLAASLALAGTGYADAVSFVILAGLTCLLLLIVRKALPLLALAAGAVLALPGLERMLRYLFLGEFQAEALELHLIMKNGYRFGQFFSSYSFRDGHPGMGLGLMIGLLGGAWLWFVLGERKSTAVERGCTATAVLLLLVSLRCFPWDVAQRLGTPFLRMISLMDTPAIFAGFSYAALCIPAAGAAGRISRQENSVIAGAVPLVILLAGIGLCVYQCNMLAYVRAPLGW